MQTLRDDVAAALCHELNQPLSYLISSLSLARSSLVRACTTAGDPELFSLLKWVDAASAGAEHMSHVLGDFRARTLGEAKADVPVDLSKVIRRMVSMVEVEAKRRARVTCDLPPAMVVMGSEPRFAQVFLNLLVSALQRIPHGRPDAHELVVRGVDPGDGRVEVEVRDDGAQPEPGTLGVGLAVCQRIVNAAQGRLAIEPAASGWGTRARVTLPRATEQR